jgi:ribose transport system permease protein
MKIKSQGIRRLVAVGLVLVLCVVFAITTPTFFGVRNISILLKDAAFLGLVAAGMAFPMIGGGIDLSLGGIVCATGIICVHLSYDFGFSGYMIIIVAIIIGAAFGIINGIIVAKVGLTEFVATLASGFLFLGIGRALIFKDASGRAVTRAVSSDSYLSFGKTPLWENGMYLITVVWIIVVIALYIILKKTKFGLYTYAIGSNDKAAKMSGVNTTRIKILGYVISGACAGLAAFLVTANLTSSPAALGDGYEFKAIAACVVGGIMLGGGKGDTVNAFIGALFMTIILNGIYKFGLDSTYVYIIQGAIILAATAFDSQFAKFASKRRLQEQRLSDNTPASA